jgi:hypothetical protein
MMRSCFTNSNQQDDDDDSPFRLRREIQLYLLSNLNADAKQIADHIERIGAVRPSTVTVGAIRSAFFDHLRLFREHGLLETLSPEPKRFNRQCVSCGREFATSRSHSKTCSRICRVKYHRNKKN